MTFLGTTGKAIAAAVVAGAALVALPAGASAQASPPAYRPPVEFAFPAERPARPFVPVARGMLVAVSGDADRERFERELRAGRLARTAEAL